MPQPPLCARRAARWHRRAPRLIDVPPHAVIPGRGSSSPTKPKSGARSSARPTSNRRDEVSAEDREGFPYCPFGEIRPPAHRRGIPLRLTSQVAYRAQKSECRIDLPRVGIEESVSL